jgi:transposase
VNMVRNGRSVREISRSLGIGENLIYRWKSGAKISSAAAEEGCMDQEALYRRIQELEVERDILKKALLIFSRQT